MRIWIGAVGHLKEPFYRLAQDEYLKRLQRYARLAVVEVADEPVPHGAVEQDAVKTREGERLWKRLPAGSLKVALDMRGELHSSEDFACWLGRQIASGREAVAFLIGGTLGLPAFILAEADHLLSLSRMTFPHQMARVILLEQLYRAFRILRNEPYHY